MYLKFYGLSEKPFSQTPDPRFLYWNDSYREALASLRYGIQERKGFLTMIGEAGTGKTTLLRKLLDDLGPDVVSVLLFNPNASFEEILEYTLSELGIPAASGRKLAMLQRLNEFLLAAFAEGKNTILLIDEAQDLETEVLESLRLLSNLETSKEKILQIVLSGQPELATRLAQDNLRQLKQRIAVRCRLEPLAESEIGEYVAARLRIAGGPEHLFAPECLEVIWSFSHGIPRLVNTACDNALLVGYAVGKQRIDRNVLTEVVADLRRLDLDQDAVAANRFPQPSPPLPSNRPETAPRAAHTAAAEPTGEITAATTTGATLSPHPSPPDGPERPRTATPAGSQEPAPRPTHSRPEPSRRPSWLALSALGAALLAAGIWIGSRRGQERIPSASPGALAPDSTTIAAPPGGQPLPDPGNPRPVSAGGRDVPGGPPAGSEARVNPQPSSVGAAERIALPAPPLAPPEATKSHVAVAKAPAESDDGQARAGADAAPSPVSDAVEVPAAPGDARRARASLPQAAPQVNATPARRPPALALQSRRAAPENAAPPRRPNAPATRPAGRPQAPVESPPATAPQLEPSVDGTGVVVRPGDTLLGLVARTYGDVNLTTLDMVRRANPTVADVNKILPGDTIVFPDPGPAARIVPEKGSLVAVVAVMTRGIDEAQGIQRRLQEDYGGRVEVEPVSLGEGEKLYRVSLKDIDGQARAKEVAESLGTILQDPGGRSGP